MQGWLRPQGGVGQGAVGGQQERPSCTCPQHRPCRRPPHLDRAGPHAGDLAPGRWAALQKWRDLMQPYLFCPGAPPPQCSQGWSSSVSNPKPHPRLSLCKAHPLMAWGHLGPSCAQPREDCDLGCQSNCCPGLILQTDSERRQRTGRAGWVEAERAGQTGGAGAEERAKRRPQNFRTSERLVCLTFDPNGMYSCSLSNPPHPSQRDPACEATSPTSELISTFPPSCVFSLLIESW